MASDAWSTTRHRIARALSRGDESEERRLLAQLDDHRSRIMALPLSQREFAVREIQAHWDGVLSAFSSAPDAEATLLSLRSALPAAPVRTSSGDNYSAQADRGGMVSQGNQGSHQVSGQGHTVAGRDVNDSHDSRKTKVTFGGAVVALIAIVALIWGGGKIINNITSDDDSAGSLTSTSTCRDWLLADPTTQRKSAIDIALQAGNTEAARDAFIMENTQYTCGNSPDATLGNVFKVRQ
ncbi:hypothetical protein OG548_30770 [Streptomyces sp. NBC_01356]|uniref:hypothetical protein n=1 Tax=Streptomyces sp. NBC_01356 TaxID=2903836 RepID=UPI002E2F8482|nr:hypothetical protein [Streptomyces sp. NBC_01356]